MREDLSGLVTAHLWSMYETSSHSPNTGRIRLFLTVVNHSDETLSGASDLSGVFDVSWLPPETTSVSFTTTRRLIIDRSNIHTSRGYDPRTAALLVDPGDSVSLSAVWDLTTEDNTDLLGYFPTFADSGCRVRSADNSAQYFRRITYPQSFRVTGSVRLLRRMAVTYAEPIVMHHCIMIGYGSEVDDKTRPPCADLIKEEPCSLLRR